MKRTHKQAITGAAIVMLGTVLVACGSPGKRETAPGPDRTQAAFGESVRQAALRQTVDPDAGRGHGEVATDAASAVNAIGQYNRSFEQPRPAINVLGIGGMGSGGN